MPDNNDPQLSRSFNRLNMFGHVLIAVLLGMGAALSSTLLVSSSLIGKAFLWIALPFFFGFGGMLFAKMRELERRVVKLQNSNESGSIKISNAKSRELKLREKLEVIESTLELSGDVLFEIDKEACWKTLGAGWNTLTGHDVDRCIGRPVSDFIYPTDRSHNRALLESLWSGKQDYCHYEIRCFCADKSPCWVELHGKAIIDDKDDIIGISGSLRDCSSHRRAKDALEDSENKFRQLYEHGTDAVLIMEKDKITDCNGAALGMFGFESKTELRNKVVADLSPLFQPNNIDSITWADKHIEQAYRNGCCFFEWQHIGKNGELFPAEVQLTRIELGEKTIIQSIVRDISDHKGVEDALRYREAFEKLLITLSTRFINVSSQELDDRINKALKEIGTFVEVDRSYVFLFHDENRLISNTHEWCAEGISPEIDNLKNLDKQIIWYWLDSFENGEQIYIPSVADLPENRQEEKDTLLPQQVKSLIVLPIMQKTGLIGFVGFDSVRKEKHWDKKDISLLNVLSELFANLFARRDTENALHKALIKANSASKAKSEFLATMSHEIRTPLNGVIGMLELLDETELNKEQRQYLSTASVSIETLMGVIKDILDFSKIEAHKLSLESIAFDLKDEIDKLILSMLPQAKEKGLDLTMTLDHGIPLKILGDPVRLRQVLYNLINNAIKFSDEGQVRVSVQAERKDDDNAEYRISIQDDGIGIPKEKLDTIFEQFSQADMSTTRKYGGAGLGLAICKRLAVLMHGDIEVQSHLGEGSVFTFIFRLPIDPDPPSPNPESIPHTERPPKRNASLPVNPAKILLVDDYPVNLIAAKAILSKLNCDVLTAKNGKIAVEMVSEQPFDLVFMDMQMPVMDGLEASKAIRNMKGEIKNIPIVAMTANAMEGDRQRCIDAGMDDYLSKPIEKSKVGAILSKWIVKLSDKTADSSCVGGSENDEQSIEAPVFNFEDALKRYDGDREILFSIIEDFIASTDNTLIEIERSAKDGDVTAATRYCHSVKGGASYIGAERLRETAYRMEKMGKEGKMESILKSLPKLKESLLQYSAAVEDFE